MADKPDKPPILVEWEKAQEGWDAARRAAGAIPPLPQRNSAEGYNEALSILGENARRGFLAASESGALSRFEAERQDRKADLANAIEQSGQSSEKPMFDVHADDKAIIIAVGGGAFCAGLFGFYEDHPILGIIFTVGGLVTMAPISPFVRSHIGWAFGRPALWTLAVSTWLFLAANLGFAVYDRLAPQPPTGGPTGNPTSSQHASPHYYWPPLNDGEAAALEALAKRATRPNNLRIICVDSDCRELAGNLVSVFHAAGWPVSLEFTGNYTESVGIDIYQPDPKDRTLANIIEQATYLKVDAVKPTDFPGITSIFIGIKP